MVDTSDYFRQFDEDLISSKLQEPTKLNLVENDDDEYKAILNSIDISTSPTRPIDDGSLDVEESTDRISQDFDDRDQDSLASQYYTLYPDIFDTEERQTEDGDTIVVPTKLNNITKAKELGIVDDRPDVRVPTGDAEIIPSSTLSGLELKYNTQAVATTRQKQSARADMSRLERGAAEREESEKFIEQEVKETEIEGDNAGLGVLTGAHVLGETVVEEAAIVECPKPTARKSFDSYISRIVINRSLSFTALYDVIAGQATNINYDGSVPNNLKRAVNRYISDFKFLGEVTVRGCSLPFTINI